MHYKYVKRTKGNHVKTIKCMTTIKQQIEILNKELEMKQPNGNFEVEIYNN